MILGITGNIASGKTTALRFFEQHGYRVFNTELLLKKELLPQNAEAVKQLLGPAVVLPDNSLNFDLIADLIHHNDTLYYKYNSLVQGLLRPVLIERINSKHAVAVEMPLLFENGYEPLFDKVLCMYINPKLQWERLLARHYTPDTLYTRLRHQLPITEKIRRSDFVISGEGDLYTLEGKLIQLHQILRKES